MKYLGLFSVIFFVMFGESADARRMGAGAGLGDEQRYVIDINGYQGRSYSWMELNLKDLLRSNYSVRLARAELIRVELEGRSMDGGTLLDLVIGDTVVDSGRLRRRSNTLVLRNRSGILRKRWLLDIRGTVHIDRVVIHFEKNRNHGGQGYGPGTNVGGPPGGHSGQKRTVSLGEQKIQKGVVGAIFGGGSTGTYTFYAHGRRGGGIRLFCTKRKVRVSSVRVRLQNGRERRIYGLDRTYRNGDFEKYFFPSESWVEAIIVEASTPSVKGGRGILGVELFSY